MLWSITLSSPGVPELSKSPTFDICYIQLTLATKDLVLISTTWTNEIQLPFQQPLLRDLL